MSLPKPTGLKAPSKISKSATVTGLGQAKSGIPGLALKAQSAIAKSARSAGFSTYPANLYAEEVSHKLPGPEPQVKSPPVDDFIIGDRVWVGGTKPGFIAFLGETQFAPGEWAGVVLDEPVGKNDGSVSGVRYFQCEAKRGVFARISKLSRTEGAAVSAPAQVSRADGERNGTKTPTSNLLAPRSTTPKLGQLSVSRTSSGSTSSLNKASPPPSATQLVNDVKHNFKTGDRVLVSGTKPGTLRYIGQTDFSKGIWAGVELDDPMGKNDGAVAGKRYFNCQPLYGLFAPVHKVAKLPGSATSVGMTTPRSSKLPASGGSSSGLRASRERSGSQDSVSSISSSASSVSRSRVRLGVGSLNNQAKATPSGRPSSLNLSATTSALQKALKEKEEHIEQLLRERDLERSEVARAAAQVDEAESQLANTKCEYDRFREDADESVKKMKLRLAELEKEKLDLTGILEDERRKTEDLQFQIEEESICKDDLEIKTEEDEAKVKDLEVQLRKEKERGDKFEAEVQKMKVKLESFQSESKSSTDLQTEYLDQIEELTHKLSQAENKIKTFESGKQDDNAKSSQLSQQLAERSQRLTEVEAALDTKKKDLKQMESRLAELETERKDGQIKHQKLQSTIDDLTAKLTQKDAASTSMNTEIQQLKTKFEDSQRQLQASKAKSDQLADDKQKLEQQIEDLMKNSGDSTSQLTILNEQLREKDRKLEEQLAALSNFTQKNAELDTSIDTLKAEHNRGVEELINKHKEELKTLQGNRDDLQAEVEKLHTKLTNLLEQHNEEKTELESSKLREVTILKENLQTAQNEQKHLQENLERNKTTMETFTADNENMKFEKEKLERTLKRLEGERDSLQAAVTEAQSEISAAKDEASKAQTELEQLKAAHGELGSQQGSIEEKLKSVNAEKEQLLKEKTQLEQKLQSSLTDSTSAHGESERLRVENTELGSQVEKQAALVAQHLQQISKLTEENLLQAETLRNLQEEGKVSAGLQSELDEVKAVLLATQNKLSSAEQEKEGLKAENSTVLQQLNDNQRNFEGTKAQFESSLQELTQRVADISSESESTKTRLKDSLDNSTDLLQQREQEISAQKTQIASLEREKTALEDYRTRSSQLETEVTDLRQQLSNLHTQLEESKSSAALVNNPDVDGDPVLAKLKSEKESLGGQVEFLNSVIVELQNKNEALAVRLQAMESGDHINGGLQAAVESPSKVRPPRLFCDICDIFDKHETEDCPLQAMSDSETPPPSSHHGSRTAERAYCDICEVFGHWTTECDDEQTF